MSRFVSGGAIGTGIDISPVAIKLARQNFENRKLAADFLPMDGEQVASYVSAQRFYLRCAAGAANNESFSLCLCGEILF